jgi:hypothetical protein
MTITEFLAARLDEEEARAGHVHLLSCGEVPVEGDVYGATPCDCGMPARVLREVEAKRKLIQRYEVAAALPESNIGVLRSEDRGYREACMDAIRDAAAVFADHGDYEQEWRL